MLNPNTRVRPLRGAAYNALRAVIIDGQAQATGRAFNEVERYMDDEQVTGAALELSCRLALRCANGGRPVVPTLDLVFWVAALSAGRWRDALTLVRRLVGDYEDVTGQGCLLAYAFAQEFLAAGRARDAEACCRYGGFSLAQMADRQAKDGVAASHESLRGKTFHMMIPFDGGLPTFTELDLDEVG